MTHRHGTQRTATFNLTVNPKIHRKAFFLFFYFVVIKMNALLVRTERYFDYSYRTIGVFVFSSFKQLRKMIEILSRKSRASEEFTVSAETFMWDKSQDSCLKRIPFCIRFVKQTSHLAVSFLSSPFFSEWNEYISRISNEWKHDKRNEKKAYSRTNLFYCDRIRCCVKQVWWPIKWLSNALHFDAIDFLKKKTFFYRFVWHQYLFTAKNLLFKKTHNE